MGMDKFLSELLNPGAIVRTLILAVVGFYLVKRVDRYWSYRSAKSIQKRIKYIEDDKLVLENLAKSDRSIFLRSFIMLFEMIRWGSAFFAFRFWLTLIQGSINPI